MVNQCIQHRTVMPTYSITVRLGSTVLNVSIGSFCSLMFGWASSSQKLAGSADLWKEIHHCYRHWTNQLILMDWLTESGKFAWGHRKISTMGTYLLKNKRNSQCTR